MSDNDSYSARVRAVRAMFSALDHSLQSVDAVRAYWSAATKAARLLAMDSMSCVLRLNTQDFEPLQWKTIKGTLEIFENEFKCAEARRAGRRLEGFVLKPDDFDEAKAASFVERRKKKSRTPKTTVVVQEVIKTETKVVIEKQKRVHAAPSVSIIIDLANITKPTNSGLELHQRGIDWAKLRDELAMYKGQPLPIERAIICISKGYMQKHSHYLAAAKQYFEVKSYGGDKEADPVVMAEIDDVLFTHLLPSQKFTDRLPVIVLVSGDTDFSFMLAGARKHAAWEELTLKLRVVTWAQKLSGELSRLADETTFIEELLPRIDRAHRGYVANGDEAEKLCSVA